MRFFGERASLIGATGGGRHFTAKRNGHGTVRQGARLGRTERRRRLVEEPLRSGQAPNDQPKRSGPGVKPGWWTFEQRHNAFASRLPRTQLFLKACVSFRVGSRELLKMFV